MIHLVVAAFLGTDFTDLSAQAADGRHLFAAPRHGGGGKTANGAAIKIQADAAGHGLGVFLVEASGGAVLAGRGTCVAGLYAICELLVAHVSPFDVLDVVGLANDQPPPPCKAGAQTHTA